MDYLGIRVKSKEELMIDPAKKSPESRIGPTTLTTIKEVRSTLGLLGYHRPWIPNFAKIAKPLTDLLQKGSGIRVEVNTVRKSRSKTNWRLVTSETRHIIPPDTDQQFYPIRGRLTIRYWSDTCIRRTKNEKDARGNPLLRPPGI